MTEERLKELLDAQRVRGSNLWSGDTQVPSEANVVYRGGVARMPLDEHTAWQDLEWMAREQMEDPDECGCVPGGIYELYFAKDADGQLLVFWRFPVSA
jgi:hypothetical protein